MTDGSSAAGYAMSMDAAASEVETKKDRTVSLLKAIPWTRVLVDGMLLAAMLVASSKLFAP